jgi:hypothetical protein
MTRLEARCLAWKSGFMDGDLLDDVLWPVYGLGPSYEEDDTHHLKFKHEVLARAVEQYLLPLLDPRVPTMRIGTIHNPVRAENPKLAGLSESSVCVEVPDDEILRIAAHLWNERYDRPPVAPK